MDSSWQLASIYTIYFIIILHLMFLVGVQISDVMELNLLILETKQIGCHAAHAPAPFPPPLKIGMQVSI